MNEYIWSAHQVVTLSMLASLLGGCLPFRPCNPPSCQGYHKSFGWPLKNWGSEPRFFWLVIRPFTKRLQTTTLGFSWTDVFPVSLLYWPIIAILLVCETSVTKNSPCCYWIGTWYSGSLLWLRGKRVPQKAQSLVQPYRMYACLCGIEHCMT